MCVCGVNTSPANVLKGEEVNALRKAQNSKFLQIKKKTNSKDMKLLPGLYKREGGGRDAIKHLLKKLSECTFKRRTGQEMLE